MAEVTIETTPNGPYLVTGPIELRDTDGKALATKGKVWLCRCGASTKKPLCDGTHSKIGFQARHRPYPDRPKGADRGRIGCDRLGRSVTQLPPRGGPPARCIIQDLRTARAGFR